jgi:two-component system cell cycle response regulator DivK
MGNTHALIIDDDANNLGILAQLLSEEGVSHTGVQNPKNLRNALSNIGQVDVIFLDLEMPGLNGYQVLDMLRANQRFQHTPVVAYTVHVSEISFTRQQGFDGFLGKPLDPDLFPKQLARILRGESVWSTSRTA